MQRLTLLRSPKCPDAATDMGRHVVRYGLLPHAGGWQAGGVVAAAAAFNVPLVPVPRMALKASGMHGSGGNGGGWGGALLLPALQVSATKWK